MSVIDERLADPRLNAEMLAREQGISRRRLDQLFVSALRSSVAACIVQRRLGRAAELSMDRTCSFGVSPTRWRADAAASNCPHRRVWCDVAQ